MDEIGIRDGRDFSSKNYIEILGEKQITTKVIGFQEFPKDSDCEMALSEYALDNACEEGIQYIDLPESASCSIGKKHDSTYKVGDIKDHVDERFKKHYERGGLLLSGYMVWELDERPDPYVNMNFSRQRFSGNYDPEIKSTQLYRTLQKLKKE